MEQNIYRNELERLRFTEKGKAALTDALMAEQTAGESRRHARWMKRGVAAALAAVLLVGTAAAVAGSLWENYFGLLDQGQQEVLENLSKGLPAAVTSNGTTITPLDAFGAKGVLYLMLEVEAPAGTVLPVLDEEEAVYWLSGGVDPAVRMRLETADGREWEDISYSTDVTCLEDDDPTDNKIIVVVNLSADQDLSGLTLHIPGLWKWETDNTFTPIFTGDFSFLISENMGKGSAVTLDVDGVTTQTPWGPITLQTMELSPLGIRWSYRIDDATARAAEQAAEEMSQDQNGMSVQTADGSQLAMEVSITPDAPVSVVLKDGTEVSVSGRLCRRGGRHSGLLRCLCCPCGSEPGRPSAVGRYRDPFKLNQRPVRGGDCRPDFFDKHRAA